MIPFPDVCAGCVPPRRHIHCHAECPDYLEAKARHEEETKEDRRRWQAERDAAQVVYKLSKG